MKPEFYSVPKRRLRPFYVMGILFVVTIALSLLIFFNLKKYAVYYAEHTPHADNINPAAVELVDNMYFNYNPRDDLYFKWKNGIIYTIDFSGKYSYPKFGKWSAFDDSKYHFIYQEDSNVYYVLNSNLNVINVWYVDSVSINPSLDNDTKHRIEVGANAFIEPIIEAQPKPFLLNFQGLYDLFNHERFG